MTSIYNHLVTVALLTSMLARISSKSSHTQLPVIASSQYLA